MSSLFNGTDNNLVSQREGQSAGQFAASLIAGIAAFGIQILVFLLIKDRLARIYQPRTYLVPARERTDPAAPGWFLWIKSVLNTTNSEFVQRCGLDAYFFLRYLRTLLKIFVPAAILILPVLVPLNTVGGRGADYALTNPQYFNVTGLDQLAWGNVRPDNYNRYWGHWIMALILFVWIGFVAFDELRNYIRMRQAYMTSPQHRIRASATTVLVSAIPQKWCSIEALDGLYDVFPGGLRNIWINRNFDELSEKVHKRDKLATKLEQAETDLIKKCFKKNEENIAKAEKQAGKSLTKDEKKRKAAEQDAKGRKTAEGQGLEFGDPHQTKHTIQEALGEEQYESSSSSSDEDEQSSQHARNKRPVPIPILGEGIQVVTDGLEKFSKGFLGGLRGANKDINNRIDTTNGFAPEQAHPSGAHLDVESRNRSHSNGVEMSRHQAVSPLSQTEFDQSSDRTRVPAQSYDSDRRPLKDLSPTTPKSPFHKEQTNGSQGVIDKAKGVVGLGDKSGQETVTYAEAFNKEFKGDAKDAVWKKYMTEKDRDTMRLPIFGWQWMPALPLMGKKVDTIYYCREEVARLNVEIEDDQANPERFPLMNSAFIQFNHQVAAHMACQSLSHHVPKQMAPRLVEIDPNDVIWDNMSIPWWQTYIRTAGVIAIVIGMIILWAIPVAFTSALSQLSAAADTYPWLSFINRLPTWFISVLQGILPPVLLGLLMFLLPLILRYLAKLQGTKSGMLVELSVQKYYFFFLFVQLFLIVTVGAAITKFLGIFENVAGFTEVPGLLGSTIPSASNYFFSYMILQALSVSSGALLQIGALVVWFVLAPILDSTARAKFNRQTSLQTVQWGTFFPVYTNLACIGIVYSVISPLILVFNIITFSLFWFVYRYNTLYVTRFTRDTGGLLYPNAINYTFVGVYVAQIALIGMFFLVRSEDGSTVCQGQAIGMIIMLILTAGYQILLNNAFAPLFRYLPITLEDDAVRRDQEFERALRSKHEHDGLIDNERDDEDIEDQLEDNERRSLDKNGQTEGYEMRQVGSKQHSGSTKTRTNHEQELEPYEFQNPEIAVALEQDSKGRQMTKKMAKKTINAAHHLAVPQHQASTRRSSGAWADRSQNRRSAHFGQPYSPDRARRDSAMPQSPTRSEKPQSPIGPGHYRTTSRREALRGKQETALDIINNFNPLVGTKSDLEAQRAARAQLSDALFSGVNDELEDLTPEQRDSLVQRAFQHSALRARRPVIWLPRDDLGVSDGEIQRMAQFSNNLWVSNVRQGLDSKGRTVYSGAPPDFSEVDVIQL